LRCRQEIGELDRLVAVDARDRGFAAHIALDERLDHFVPESRLVIEHVMRNVEVGCHAPRVMDILAGAARASAPRRLAMIIKLECDAHHAISRDAEQCCGNGGIDTYRHGTDHGYVLALRGEPTPPPES